MKKDLSLYKKYLKMQKPQKFAGGGQAQSPQQIGQNPFAFLNQQDGSQGLNMPMNALGTTQIPQSPTSATPMGTTSDPTNPNITGANNPLVTSGQATVQTPMAGGAGDQSPASNPFLSTLSSMAGAAPAIAAYNGGKIQGYDEGGGVLSDLADSFKKAFGTPTPAPTPDPTLQQKYDAIRKQNRKNFDSPDEEHFEGGISGSTHKAQYQEGGEVIPQSQQERDAESEEITKREDDKKFQDDAEKKELQDESDKKDKNFSKGGKVKKPEHNLNNLKDLKAAFDKFISEEGKEPRMASGGKVGSGERFAKLENKLSHQKGVTDPGALAASIGRKKYGNAKMNKMAQAHMADGGEVPQAIIKTNLPQPSPSPAPLTQDEINKRSIGNYFADGGKVNMAAPNNGKLPYYQPHNNIELYKKYLAMNSPKDAHFADGTTSVSKYANDPNFQAWQAANPNVPAVVADLAYENSLSAPTPDTQPIPQATVPNTVNPYQNMANYAVNGAGSQPDQGQYNGGKIQHFDDGGQAQSDIQQELADVAKIPVDFTGNNQDSEELSPHQGPMRDENGSLSGPKEETIAEEMSDSGVTPTVDADELKNGEDSKGEEKRELASEDIEKPAEVDESGFAPIFDKDESPDLKDETSDSNESDKDQIAKAIDEKSSAKTELAQAQRDRDINIANQQMAKGAALLGAGIAGHGGTRVDPSLALKTIGENDKYVGMPVEKYQEQIENQKNDPNSQVSQAYREVYGKVMGTAANPKWSASDIGTTMPALEKYMQAQQLAQSRTQMMQDKLQAQAQQKEQDRELKRTLASEKNETQAQAKKDAADKKTSDTQDKALMQTQTLLESARGNPAAAQAEKDLYSVQKANSLINMYGDPDKLSPQQVNLLVSEVSKIATGGVPTGHEQEALQPGTVASKVARLYSQMANDPTPANAGAFIKQFQDYNNALAKDAQHVIQDKYGRVIESRKKQLGDDNYQSLQDNYINRFKQMQSEEKQGKTISNAEYQAYSQKYGPDKAAKLLSVGGYKLGQ